MSRAPTKEEIENIFKAVDADSDGFISVEELFNALGKTNFRKDEIESVVKALDKDGDGKVNITEFLKLFEVLAVQQSK